jgi:hypothetical protein
MKLIQYCVFNGLLKGSYYYTKLLLKVELFQRWYNTIKECILCHNSIIPMHVFVVYFVMLVGMYIILIYTITRGSQRSSRNSLLSMVSCTMSLHHLDSMLLVISTCKFCSGHTLQFNRWQGQWYLHRDNARITCCAAHPCQERQFMSSPIISFRVNFGCSLLWKWASRGHVSQPWRTSNQMWRLNSGRFKKLSPHWCFQQWQDQWIKCGCMRVRKGPTLSYYVVPLQCSTTILGSFWLPMVLLHIWHIFPNENWGAS